jgi:hypothetical protein
VLALGVTGCKDSGTATQAAPADAKEVAANAAALDDLYRKITGNVQQRVAGEQLTYHLVQKYTADCMAKLKVTYYPPSFATAYEGLSDADLTYGWDNGGWLGPTSAADLGVQRSKLSQARAAALNQTPTEVAAMSDAAKAKYGDQVGQCVPPEDLYDGKGTAASADDLQDKLNAAVSKVLATPAVQKLTSGYGACMARAGYSGVTDPGAVQRRVSAKYPAVSQAPVDGKAAGPGWADGVAAEAKAAAADAGCRKQIYDVAMTTLGPELGAFSAAQAAALTQVAKEWDAIVKAAAATN